MNSSGVKPGRSSHSGTHPAPGASRPTTPAEVAVLVLVSSSMVAADKRLPHDGAAAVVVVDDGTTKALVGASSKARVVAVNFIIWIELRVVRCGRFIGWKEQEETSVVSLSTLLEL